MRGADARHPTALLGPALLGPALLGLALATVALLGPNPARAQLAGPAAAQAEVITCLSAMGTSTGWEDCVAKLFAPCAAHPVATPAHIDCLQAQKSQWRQALNVEVEALAPRLTADGARELTQLMGSWVPYVGQKCASVAAGKAAAAAEAAQTGCEISEIAGALTEIAACAERRSPAPFCVFRKTP